MPDLPGTLPVVSGLAAAVVAAGGSTLPAGTYTVVLTAKNRWGETLQTAAVAGLIVGANQGIQITAPTLASVPGATSFRAYFALTGQPYSQLQESTVIPFTISTPGLPGTPPNRVTAFYPDSDGRFASAYTLFRWLNSAILAASMVARGIPDTSGFPTVAAQGLFYPTGIWKKFFHGWFDGFPVAFAGSQDMFYRNKLQGVTFLALVQYNAERVVMELQPQPGRTAGSTTLAAPVAVGDTIIQLTDSSTFGLTLGLARIGGPTGEIIEYSGINGNNLTGCVRGLSGTVESAWAGGQLVDECNFRFSGMRLFTGPEFFPGDSAKSLNIPLGWKDPIIDYMLMKFKEGEQSSAEVGRKMKEFENRIKSSIPGNELVAGPRQIGGSSYAGDGYPTGGGFRVIVP